MSKGSPNELPPPRECDQCCSVNIKLTTNDRVYGRIYGQWPHVYFCEDCGAAVGCHPGTYIPLGRMADRQTRQLRARAHEAFDPLWRSGLMSRSTAYRWLAGELSIEHSACHISWLSKDQLHFVIKRAKEYYEEREHVAERRKEKRRDRSIKRNKRTRDRIAARKSRD